MYVLYVSGKNGEGYVQEIGRFESVSEIEIRVGLFREDTVISIQEEPVEISEDPHPEEEGERVIPF